jgi:hypothetical protein
MIYAYRDAGKWIIASLMPRFKGVGGWHTLTDAERAKHGWYPCIEVNANYNPTTQIRSPAEFVLANGIVTATYTIWDKPNSQIYAETLAEARDNRAKAYAEEADPLFFKAQRDEAELTEWEAKVQEIRDRFPYPDEPALN